MKKDRGITVQVGQMERMHFVLAYEWRLLLEWLIEKWRLLPVIWWMATPAYGLIDGVSHLWLDWCILSLRDGDFCQIVDWWAVSPRGLITGHSPFSGVVMGCSPTSGLSLSFTLTVFNSSPVMLSPMKIAECLYCGVNLSLILPILFCFIKFTCHIQSYIHTFIYSYIHSYTYSCI